LWRVVNSRRTLAVVLVETTDLIDSAGVAALLRLANSRAVSTYRKRYADFPAPVVEMGAGRCLLWLRADVEAWKKLRD
jgi:hypothetical protein